MGVGGGAIGYVISVSITCCLRSYLPQQIFSVDYIVRHVSLDLCFGRKQPSATSFMSLIILVWWTGISSSSVSPGIVPYPLERDDGDQTRLLIRHFKVTLGQIQSTWSFHARWSHIFQSSSISMEFDYLLQSPCFALLFPYLARIFSLCGVVINI